MLQVVRYKQNVLKHDDTEEIMYPKGTSLLQFVSDNTDHDIATLDGKNTHHGLDSIAVANGCFDNVSVHRQRIPVDKNRAWSNIKSNEGIKTMQYMPPDTPALNKAVLKPMVQVIHS